MAPLADRMTELGTETAFEVLARANAMGEGGWQMRSLLKKARLPRLAKAVSQSS